jgi:DNA-binding response OmpR family regulator
MKKILVIEDEKSVRQNLIRILRTAGFQVNAAPNGVVGLQLAQEDLPDLILCDVMMPELDGFGVIKELQKNPQTALIPFIFLTGKADHSDLRQGLELGADDYLTKPFEVDELLRAIEARFNKHQLQENRYELLINEMKNIRKLMEAKEHLWANLEQELRRPLSNIIMALKMLEHDVSKEQRERYLQILKSEFSREISLLNESSKLQELLTPETVTLLTQFNFLKPPK